MLQRWKRRTLAEFFAEYSFMMYQLGPFWRRRPGADLPD
jgi:hypothetical protein